MELAYFFSLQVIVLRKPQHIKTLTALTLSCIAIPLAIAFCSLVVTIGHFCCDSNMEMDHSEMAHHEMPSDQNSDESESTQSCCLIAYQNGIQNDALLPHVPVEQLLAVPKEYFQSFLSPDISKEYRPKGWSPPISAPSYQLFESYLI